MYHHIPLLVLASLAAAPALALELPNHKPGLWELKVMMAGGGGPSLSLQRCTDAATDTLLTALAIGWAEGSCSKRDMQRDGNRMVVDTVCKVGNGTATTHVEIVGSFDSAYTLNATTREEGAAGAPPVERKVAGEGRWLGQCAAGQKPGDIILPGGVTMNIRNLGSLLGGAR